MGLINGNDSDGFYSPYIEHYDNNNMNNDNNRYATPTDSDESDTASLDNHRNRRGAHHVRRARHQFSVSQENLAKGGHKLGLRRRRRVDNLKYLMALDEKDTDFEDCSSSTFEAPTSLFQQLLHNPEKMEAWNHFVECSEEEQQRILNYRGLHDIKEDNEDDSVEMEEGCELTSEENWVMILDKRSSHPAYSPKECYSRVDKNLRALLKRRQLPMGMLSNLEREVITFFTEWPSSVFICDIDNGFERMLLHGLCQYLKLYSKSFDIDGARKTQIENRMPDFRPPSLLLTEYLQQNQHSL